MAREGQKVVSLWLPNHIADRLEDLCTWYGTEKTGTLRRLIMDEYDRILIKMGGKEIAAKLAEDRQKGPTGSTRDPAKEGQAVKRTSGEWKEHPAPASESGAKPEHHTGVRKHGHRRDAA